MNHHVHELVDLLKEMRVRITLHRTFAWLVLGAALLVALLSSTVWLAEVPL